MAEEPCSVRVRVMVEPDELADLLQRPIQKKIVLDSRSFLDFNANHVVNAVNIVCSKLLKRRLQNDKVMVLDFLAQSFHVEIDSEFDIIIYDQSSSSMSSLETGSCLSVLIDKLSAITKSISLLRGGFMGFVASYPELCVNKMRPAALGCGPTIPGHQQHQHQHHSISQPCLPVANVGPTKILPFLFLGSQKDAECVETMTQNGIGYVLNVSPRGEKPDFIAERHFLRIPVNDNYSEKLLPYFKDAFQFLDKVREANGRALVHCLAGVSRSPTVVIAYIMHTLGMTMDTAYRYIKDKRPTISPNFNFLGQLLEYEKQKSTVEGISDKNSDFLVGDTPWSPSSIEFNRGLSAFDVSTPESTTLVCSPTQTMARLSFGNLSPLKEQPSPPISTFPPIRVTVGSTGGKEDADAEAESKDVDFVSDSHHSRAGPVENVSDFIETNRQLIRPQAITFLPPELPFQSARCGSMSSRVLEPAKEKSFLKISQFSMPLSAEVLLTDHLLRDSLLSSAAVSISSCASYIVAGTCQTSCTDDLEPVWKKRKSRSLEDIQSVSYEISGANKRKHPTKICGTNETGYPVGILANPMA